MEIPNEKFPSLLSQVIRENQSHRNFYAVVYMHDTTVKTLSRTYDPVRAGDRILGPHKTSHYGYVRAPQGIIPPTDP